MSPLRPNQGPTRPTEPVVVAPDVLINETRAAELLSVNPRTMQQWRLRGVGPPFVRISSRCVRYRYRDLQAWIEKLLCSAGEQP